MEIPSQTPRARIGFRFAGSMALLAHLQSMGAGFAAANAGEAGLRRDACIMKGDPTAKQAAQEQFQVPDAPPQSWTGEQHP